MIAIKVINTLAIGIFKRIKLDSSHRHHLCWQPKILPKNRAKNAGLGIARLIP